MTDTKRITAYDAGKLGWLVPVQIKQSSRDTGILRWWNGLAHRWHRRAGR